MASAYMTQKTRADNLESKLKEFQGIETKLKNVESRLKFVSMERDSLQQQLKKSFNDIENQLKGFEKLKLDFQDKCEELKSKEGELRKIEGSLNEVGAKLKTSEKEKAGLEKSFNAVESKLKDFEKLETDFQLNLKELKKVEAQKLVIDDYLKITLAELERLKKVKKGIIGWLQKPIAAFTFFLCLTIYQIPITALVIIGKTSAFLSLSFEQMLLEATSHQFGWAFIGAAILEFSTMYLILNRRKFAAYAGMASMGVIGCLFFRSWEMLVVVGWVIVCIHEFSQVAKREATS